MNPKNTSISRELEVMRFALEGVRVLAEGIVEGGDRTRPVPSMAYSIRSIVILLDHRMRSLDRAARGEMDPEMVWSPHTSAFKVQDRADEDLMLEAWSPKERVRRSRANWERTKTALRWHETKGQGK